MPTPPAAHVLVIDDDADTCANLRDILELDDYQVDIAGTIAEALHRTDWTRYAAILLDRKLPDGTAEEVLPQLRRLAPEAAVLVVTGYADLQGAIAAIRQGAADYITKPINPDLIRSRLAHVAEKRQAAEEIARLNRDLRHRVTELETLLEVIPIGIAIANDPECRHVRTNAAFTELLRLPTGANVSATASPEERPAYRVFRDGRELAGPEMPMQVAAAQGTEVRDVELTVTHPDGTAANLYGSAVPLFDEQGRPRGAVGAFLDITERKRAEEHRLQTERLAAIGQMMTGLAHESGNALARSQSCLEMLAWEVEDRPEALDLISRVQKAQDHLRSLYEDVRNYAAPIRLERDLWDVSAIWRQAWENLALRRQGRDAALQEETDGTDLRCVLDPFRLEQVFRNMFENSLAACPGPMRVTVRTMAARLGDCPAVRIAVKDNGPGLSAEQKQRIFDPFFTTKTKGTGLGMAIAKRIIEAHGGHIAIGPANGGGAEIVITLPREGT